MKYKIRILLPIIVVLFGNIARAQVHERSREISRQFRVYDQTNLEIYNKYGNIHLFTWDIDSVKIDIHVAVKASKEQKVDRIFEYIDFEITDSKYYVIARTQFKQNQGSFWAELTDLANTVFSGNTKTQIDYEIYLPKDVSVKLENKFGNIYCTNHSGKITVDLSNGDFRANNLTGEANLSLDFGNSIINRINQGTVNTGYGEIEIREAGNLTLESKSSEIEIGKAVSLQINSRRDTWNIEVAEVITGESYFSYLHIDALDQVLDLKSDYGEISLKDISAKYGHIKLMSRYTDVYVQLTQAFSGNVNIKYNSTDLHLPDNFKALSQSKTDEEQNPDMLSGFIGLQTGEIAKAVFTLQYGKFTVEYENQEF